MTSVENAEQIRLQSLLEIFRRHFFDRFSDNSDAGIID